MTYIGPPWISPRLSGPLNWTASVQVKNLVAMPARAQTHIQKTVPGPAVWMATATPAMLAMPIVLARALLSAWKWVTWPVSVGESYLPARIFSACPMYRKGIRREYAKK